MGKNIIKEKTFLFAIRIINLHKHLSSVKKEFVMSKQVLRSGTSVGANCREGDYAESQADFIHKFSIAQKECNETIYWLELLHATDYIEEEQFNSINTDAIELMKLLTASIKTAKRAK